MLDFIINNIFVLIPVAILIGIRIVNARRKSQEAAGNDSKNTAKRIFDDDPPVRPHVPTSPAPAKKQPAKTRSVSAPTAKAAETLQPKPAVTPAPESKDFTQKLKYLSPLQRAVAFLEILGPPKGM